VGQALQGGADFEPDPDRDAPEAERDPETTIDEEMSDTFRDFAETPD
jgi:hypothetical protein